MNAEPFRASWNNVVIYVQPVDSRYDLTMGAVMFAVWDAAVAMSEWNLYYSTMVEVFDRNVLIGKLWIAPWSSSSSMENKGKPLGELNGLEEAPSSFSDRLLNGTNKRSTQIAELY